MIWLPLGSVLLDIGAIAGHFRQPRPAADPTTRRAAVVKPRRSCPRPGRSMSTKAWRSMLSAIARRNCGLSKGGLSIVDQQVTIDPFARFQLADRLRRLALDVFHQRHRQPPNGKVMSNLPAMKARLAVAEILDDRIFDAIEIRPPRLPVIRVAGHLNVLVGLVLDEFEGAGADRMLAHLVRRHMAGIDRRETRPRSASERQAAVASNERSPPSRRSVVTSARLWNAGFARVDPQFLRRQIRSSRSQVHLTSAAVNGSPS